LHPPFKSTTMSEQNAKRDWKQVKRRASRIVNLRLTPEEEEELRQRAAGEQTTIAHYLKAAGFERPITRRARLHSTGADVEALRAIHANLGRLAGNSHQIARALNFGQQVPAIEAQATLKEIRDTLQELRAELFTALNREP